jgi:hypothetical protein
MEAAMTDALLDLLEEERAAVDILARDYDARRGADPGFDGEAFFLDLRRRIEARAQTLELVRTEGPMGGGGADEA